MEPLLHDDARLLASDCVGLIPLLQCWSTAC